MKKKLVVLLAVVMMFAFSASAYAATFSDVSERPVVEQDAIKKAVALGIIEGYEDGTFGPDKTITRAEFAKIAVTAAGAKDTATMLEANASNFKDVKANSWYTGWINASESLGIFKGDTNGNFRPNDTISNQEAITVLMRLLGYNDNLTGSWPVNYVTKANQINILDDVNIVASAAAKRGDITVMLSATLDSDLVTYDKDTNEFVKKQTTKSGSDYITLLADSFEGSYLEVLSFTQIDQLRDVPAQTLNWNVGTVQRTVNTTVNGVTSSYTAPANYNGTLIVDKDTAVSFNGESLFDIENHQGKVYYVKGTDDKLYARFIEVESYTQTVTDNPSQNGNRVTVNKTNYNAVDADDQVWGSAAQAQTKNTNYTMYFNDDDQVYRVMSDQDFNERTYYVKSLTSSSARLVGSQGDKAALDQSAAKTVNMSDADTLIWDGDKFIAPSDLKAGDAVREIVEGDLYVKVADVSGTLTRYTFSNGKVTVGGKSYVVPGSAKAENNIVVPFYDEDLEDAGVSLEDVYNNNVRYILNKNNTVAAIIVDETSTGTTLYGIITDGGNNTGSWSKSMSSITLFTQEGNNVTYDFEKSFSPSTDKPVPNDMGSLVAYKLNTNGEIKSFKVLNGSNTTTVTNRGYKLYDATFDEEVEVKNNAYLVGTVANLTNASREEVSRALASNVVIFEVGEDDGDVDPSLVTRSSLLSGGDFKPDSVNVNTINENGAQIPRSIQYAVYDTNTSGAIKVLAYTDANTTNFHYGVIKSYNFRDYDNDHAITLVGDEATYELETNTTLAPAYTTAGRADWFAIYTQSGDKIKLQQLYQNDHGLADYAKQVTGVTDGLITTGEGMTIWTDKREGYTAVNSHTGVYNIMTDAQSIVYVINANTGDYEEGALSDISRNSYVYVPVIDKDGYADIILVDEYHRYSGNSDNNNNNNTTTSTVSANRPIWFLNSLQQNGTAGTVSVSGTVVTIRLNSQVADYTTSGNWDINYHWMINKVEDKKVVDTTSVDNKRASLNVASLTQDGFYDANEKYTYTVSCEIELTR